MEGQEAALGQQLYLATGSARPGPGSKHLGAGEGGELRRYWWVRGRKSWGPGLLGLSEAGLGV